MYKRALTPGIDKLLIQATRDLERAVVDDPCGMIDDLDDFVTKCQDMSCHPSRVRSLSRILWLYVSQTPIKPKRELQKKIVTQAIHWSWTYNQTAIICYCTKIVAEYQLDFWELFTMHRDYIMYEQPNQSSGVQSIIRNYLIFNPFI